MQTCFIFSKERPGHLFKITRWRGESSFEGGTVWKEWGAKNISKIATEGDYRCDQDKDNYCTVSNLISDIAAGLLIFLVSFRFFVIGI